MSRPVHALVGKDPWLQVRQLKALLAELPPDAQRSDYDGETAELADVLDEVRSFAMFGGAKVVVVREADEFVSRFREQLESYIAGSPGPGTLVLRLSSLPGNWKLHKIIAKAGTIVQCDPPKLLWQWAVEHAKKEHDVVLRPDAAGALIELIGADLGRLDVEIARLAVQTEGKPITADMIEENVVAQREREMYELTEELAAGHKTAALKRWRLLMDAAPGAEFRAVTWLTMWLEDMRTFLRSPNTFANAWRYKGDRLAAFKRTAQRLGISRVSAMIDALADADRRTKTGLGEAPTNIEMFLLGAPL